MKVRRLSKEFLVDLGHRIKIIRAYLKIDQKQLAEYLKTSQSQLSKIEAGTTTASLYHIMMIKKLADQDEYLRENLSWDWFLEGKGRGFF